LNKRAKWGLAAAAVVASVVVARFGLTSGVAQAPAKAKSLPLVSVAEARTLDLPVRFNVQGHLVALNQVDVRPQVNGIIRSVHFHEGDEVKQGKLLFVLDASDANAKLQRAQAQVMQIRASLDNERRNQERVRKLVASGYVSSSDVDAIVSKVDALQAQLQAAKADVESARVQVERSRIVAPVGGRTGAVTVHPGSLAQQGDAAALVNLMQLDPIGVEFSLPERALGGLLRADATGITGVSVIDADGETVPGKLNFINNTVNTDTGTIRLKAEFANARHRLWPGAFVRVTLDAGFDKGVVVLPPQAVQEGPEGHFVFQVGADGKATVHPVTLLRIQDRYAVVEGLQSGERVVVEGAVGLGGGAQVRIAESASPAASPR
jgi:RND family efflux transporter MFP subunit